VLPHAKRNRRRSLRPPRGTIIVPSSSVVRPQDGGKRAHTNHLIFVPAKHGPPILPNRETPGSIACIYQLPPYTTSDKSIFEDGCPISEAADPTTGGSGVIAIVDAYHYPTAADDFDAFSTQFALPLSGDMSCGDGSQVCFKQVSATGSTPSVNCGWSQEAALDIEWAHAMAPRAQIVLVEANSNSLSDLSSATSLNARTFVHSDVPFTPRF
jgi:kumamolisin